MKEGTEGTVYERFACLGSRGPGGPCRPGLRGFQVLPLPQVLLLGHLSLSPARECVCIFIFFQERQRDDIQPEHLVCWGSTCWSAAAAEGNWSIADESPVDRQPLHDRPWKCKC